MIIRIIATPPGFAPEEIRKAWIGLELPVATPQDFTDNPPEWNEIGTENLGGYIVLKSKAVHILRDHNQTLAADFWDSLGKGLFLRFSRDVCEPLETPVQ